MDWMQVKGNWNILKGKLREQWGKLTDDDFEIAAGQRDKLVGRLQERYGYAKDRAERELDDFVSGL